MSILISNNINSSINSQVKRFGNNFGDSRNYVTQGNKALNENRPQEALENFQKELSQNPDNTEMYTKIAQSYFNLKDYKNAEVNFLKYLEINPNNVETLINVGHSQVKQGFYQKALSHFEKAYELDNKNDVAKRNILATENFILGQYSPQSAKEKKYEYAKKNLQEALKLTTNFLGVNFMKDLHDISIEFGKTAQMGGVANIAQYENGKKRMMISDTYMYASPVVIAAYITHESIHAKDKDPYTSIREEQDAYEIATKFWIKNSNGIKDSEMDYAADLYKKSPSALKERVAEIYAIRDPDIAQTSPNHPPKKPFFNLKSKSKSVADTPIKSYNIIA